ncbi:MAG: hypothetical protein AAF234_08695 [Pseudomonadota bacterium]
MESYNFLSDLLDTFQSSSEFIKALIIVTPPAFVLGLIALLRSGHSEKRTTAADLDDVGAEGQVIGPNVGALSGPEVYPALVEHHPTPVSPQHAEPRR